MLYLYLRNRIYKFDLYGLQVMTDLIQGEFMQLGAKETENERFAHYLTKTYRKTASLIANGLKAVCIQFYLYIYVYILCGSKMKTIRRM